MTPDAAKPWYENALLLAVAGSIVVVIGQLAGTIIPIMFGSQDASDFSVVVSPSCWGTTVESDQEYGEVYVVDHHSFLRPYRFGVYLRALQVPPGVKIHFLNPTISPGHSSLVYFEWSSDVEGEFPIVIQGIGGDGRKRNTTLYLDFIRLKNDSLP